MKRLFLTLFAFGLLLTAWATAHAEPIPSITLKDLLAHGATITSGDKVFSKFDWKSDAVGPNASSVDPEDVIVLPYSQVVLGELEYGLEFLTPTMQIGGFSGLGATLEYKVTPNIPGRLISDNTLTMTAAGTSGFASITEFPTDAANDVIPLLKKPKFVVLDYVKGLDIPTDHQDFLEPVLTVKAITVIALGNVSPHGGIGIRSFTQTFSQTPEPGAIGLVLMGGLFGTAVVLRRRWG